MTYLLMGTVNERTMLVSFMEILHHQLVRRWGISWELAGYEEISNTQEILRASEVAIY